jgi:hypothetical protein
MESRWLQDAIRLSLKATTDSDKGLPEQRDPRLRKLVEGVIFSRRFVPTYHLIILGFICFLSAIHWTEKVIRWRRGRACRFQFLGAKDVYETIETSSSTAGDRQDLDGIYSSSSSTAKGSASPPSKSLNEQTPLLDTAQALRPLPRRWPVYRTAKSILMYQPRPIPIVNKILPSNGTSLSILAFIALNIFYIFFHINLNLFELFVLADRFGMVFVANLPLLYLLAAKNQPLRFLTGRSYESLNIFHRRLGELLCLAAFFHSSGMMVVWYTLIRPNGSGLAHFLLVKMILIGIGALISYELLYFTSLATFRDRWYELFLGLHMTLQVAALGFVFFHHPTARPYVGIALGIFLFDRLIYRSRIKSTTIGAYTKILEDEDTVRLSSFVFLQPQDPLGSYIWRAYSHWLESHGPRLPNSTIIVE